MIKLAVATCRSLPDWEIDDVPFYEALRERGVGLELVNWDDKVRWSDYAACLIRTTWDYMDRREAFVDWATEVERHIPLWNPARVLEWNTDAHDFYRKKGAQPLSDWRTWRISL